jgi:hypothetical protein
MLGASLAMFALVSGFVAFGSWPGAKSATNVDSVVLRDVAQAKPKAVAVRSDAVALARRAQAQRESRLALTRTHAVTPLTTGQQLAQAPASTGPATTRAAAPAVTGPVAQAPAQPTQNVTKNLDTTTNRIGGQVQQQVQNVQTQVNQVVDQVVGGPQPDTTAGGAVQTVTNTVGSALGH